ncbi:MAG TPA: DUF92 domain-containing protein [Candidatus Lokiarchaeia archaeon]|nr:DUF92 domain-containing protein [Candidatus Lokiarchaeia archaeon]
MTLSTWFYGNATWWEFLTWIVAGFVLNLAIMAWAWKKQHLTRNAGFIAFAMGWSMWLVDPVFFGLLLAFFMSSSVLSKIGRAEKKEVMDRVEKGNERDVIQVIANGLPAWICVGLFLIIILILPTPLDARAGTIFAYAVMTAIAAPNADTWSIEIGTLSRDLPRWILDLHRSVEKGTSGGVSRIGTLAALAGSALIAGLGFDLALVANLPGRLSLNTVQPSWLFGFLVVAISGFLGSILDSLFGASIQGFFECTVCKKGTEKKVHCGSPTVLLRGKAWFDNDVVNFVSVSISTLISLGFGILLFLA